MKHHRILFGSIFFVAFALLPGCTTTNTTDVTTVAPASTGQIISTVTLREMDCSLSASNLGVTVAILGTKFSAVSDSAGKFTFDSVPAGYYSFLFSKPGFTSYVRSTVAFIGTGTLTNAVNGYLERINNWKTTLSPPTISKIAGSTAADSDFQLSFPSGVANILDSSGNIVPLGVGGEILAFFSKSPSINYMDTSTYFSSTFGSISENSNLEIDGTYVRDGDTLYFLGYPYTSCQPDFQASYYVGDTLKTLYPGLGPPSNTMKIVLP
jgi:hypothetical protein